MCPPLTPLPQSRLKTYPLPARVSSCTPHPHFKIIVVRMIRENGGLLFNMYKVSVRQDQQVLEICSMTYCLQLTTLDYTPESC